MSEKIFIGKVTQKQFQSGDKVIRLGLKLEDLVKLQSHLDNGFVNLNIKTSKNGNLYCEIDTWKPTQQKQTTQTVDTAKTVTTEVRFPDPNEDDCPF